MSEKLAAGCTRPTAEVEIAPPTAEDLKLPATEPKGEKPMIRVGQKAPDFTAPAFFNDDFTQVKLSDYAGKWVVLCFYPGDFTFV